MNVRWTLITSVNITLAVRDLGISTRIRLTNCSNNELHVWVSPARIVYQVAHAVNEPVIITIEPAQVIKTQVNQHQIRRIARDHILDQVLVGSSRTATDGKVRPVSSFSKYILGSQVLFQTITSAVRRKKKKRKLTAAYPPRQRHTHRPRWAAGS